MGIDKTHLRPKLKKDSSASETLSIFALFREIKLKFTENGNDVYSVSTEEYYS